jgi:hypothetical protein
MKQFFASLAALVLVLGSFVPVISQTAVVNQPNNDLLNLLPPSDMIATADTKRLLNELLPRVLEKNPKQMEDINKAIEELKTKAGIDVQKFERVALGVKFNQLPNNSLGKTETVWLASGDFNSSAMIGVAKLAAKGQYRELKFGKKTIYLLNMKEILKDMPKPDIKEVKEAAKTVVKEKKNSTLDNIIDALFLQNLDEVALSSVDERTLVAGELGRVQAVLTGFKVQPNADLLALTRRSPNAIVSFGGNMPRNMSKILEIEGDAGDEIAKNLDSIRQMFGAFDMTDKNATLDLTARTGQTQQAESLNELLLGLQMVGSSLLSQKKDANSQLYQRLLNSLQVKQEGKDVGLKLDVSQADFNQLIASL